MILVIGTDIMPMRKGFQPIKIQKEVFFYVGNSGSSDFRGSYECTGRI